MLPFDRLRAGRLPFVVSLSNHQGRPSAVRGEL